MMEKTGNDRMNHNSKLTGANTLEISDNELESWQTIVDLIVQVGRVRAGLIMRVQNDDIEALVVSNSCNNPYKAGESEPLIGSGLYCEKVISENHMLLVPNALKSNAWKNNPDLKYGMLCYLGLPIHMPDKSLFGTICILDDKENRFSSAMITLIEKMRDLIETHLKLLHLSAYDQLTGLYNRTFFYEIVTKEMKRAMRYNTPITMLMLDIDHFKQVNDDFGHLAGDEVLRNVAQALTAALRETEIVARYGGEEFVVLLPNVSVNVAVSVAERIRALLEDKLMLACQKVTVSIGAAEYVYGEAFDDWFKRADAALYKAKSNGRNQVVVYDERDSAKTPRVNLEWKKEWNSGNRQIDEEHKTLLELGNALINISLSAQPQDKVITQLELLLKHIVSHFESEEEILSLIGYPNCSEHKKLHEELASKSLSLKEAYMNNAVKLSAFFSFIVDDVVIGHLEQEDAKFFSYIECHKEGQ